MQKAESKKTVKRNSAAEAFRLQYYLGFAREQAVTSGAQYSLELLHKGAMVSYVLPEALKNGANVIANGEFVIELTGGSGMFNI
jgi:hypothetical protein